MAKKATTLDIKPPLGGLHKATAYQHQTPFTTPSCLNVRAFDVIEERGRIGSRPGLDLAYSDELGSGTPVRMLASVTRIRDDGLRFWTDNFSGTALAAIWTTASWIGTAPAICDDTFASIGYSEHGGAVRDALSDLDTGSAYQIELFISPYKSEHWGEFSIFARMDDTTPNVETEGVKVTLVMTGTAGAYSGSITEYNAGVPGTTNFTAGNDAYAAPGCFKVHINGNVCTCYWRGTQVAQRTVTAQSGERFGFGIECTEVDGICLLDAFRIQYISESVIEDRWPLLVASAGGTVYREDRLGELEDISSSLTLSSSRQILGIERAQKLYCLDYGDLRVTEADGVIASSTTLTSASVADWTALGIDTDDDVCVLSSCVGPTEAVYEIASVAAGSLTLASSAGSAGSCTFRVERGAKVYDPAANTLTMWTADTDEGSVPTGCTVGCLYRDRLFLGAPVNAPHMWYCSKLGDPSNWDYDETESGAKSGTWGQVAEAGRIGDCLNAMISHNDDLLVFGCDNSLWVLRGDPMYQGQIDNLSHEIGIVDKLAWCRTPEGALVFLSRDGLYLLAPGMSSYPESLSREKLPRELLDVDNSLYTVSMGYDLRYRGIHIYVTRNESRVGDHWWFHWGTRTFWPVQLQTAHDAMCCLSFRSRDAEFSTVLLGCRDGYVRRYHHEWEEDGGGNEIESYCAIGPLLLGRDGRTEGVISALDATLEADSGQVTMTVHVAKTPEAVVSASAAETYTLSGGDNYTKRPHRRGAAGLIKVENAQATRAWALENIAMELLPAGKRRKL